MTHEKIWRDNVQIGNLWSARTLRSPDHNIRRHYVGRYSSQTLAIQGVIDCATQQCNKSLSIERVLASPARGAVTSDHPRLESEQCNKSLKRERMLASPACGAVTVDQCSLLSDPHHELAEVSNRMLFSAATSSINPVLLARNCLVLIDSKQESKPTSHSGEISGIIAGMPYAREWQMSVREPYWGEHTNDKSEAISIPFSSVSNKRPAMSFRAACDNILSSAPR